MKKISFDPMLSKYTRCASILSFLCTRSYPLIHRRQSRKRITSLHSMAKIVNSYHLNITCNQSLFLVRLLFDFKLQFCVTFSFLVFSNIPYFSLSIPLWMFKCINVWMFGCINVWMYECMDVKIYEWINA